jgi:hypothetical protein
MEKANHQMIQPEKLSKALLVCFIDRCINLPVNKTKKKRKLFKRKFFFNFSDREKLDENQIHFVEFELKQLKKKLDHMKVKQILNLNMYHKFYVQIHFMKN